MEETNKITR